MGVLREFIFSIINFMDTIHNIFRRKPSEIRLIKEEVQSILHKDPFLLQIHFDIIASHIDYAYKKNKRPIFNPKYYRTPEGTLNMQMLLKDINNVPSFPELINQLEPYNNMLPSPKLFKLVMNLTKSGLIETVEKKFKFQLLKKFDVDFNEHIPNVGHYTLFKLNSSDVRSDSELGLYGFFSCRLGDVYNLLKAEDSIKIMSSLNEILNDKPKNCDNWKKSVFGNRPKSFLVYKIPNANEWEIDGSMTIKNIMPKFLLVWTSNAPQTIKVQPTSWLKTFFNKRIGGKKGVINWTIYTTSFTAIIFCTFSEKPKRYPGFIWGALCDIFLKINV